MQKVITFTNDEFRIYFPYDPKMVSAVKLLPKRRFQPEGNRGGYWVADCVVDNVPALPQFAYSNEFVVDSDAAERIQELIDLKPKLDAEHAASKKERELALSLTPQIIAEYDGDEIIGFWIETRVFNREINSVIKASGCASWNRESSKWHLRFSNPSLTAIEELVSEFNLTIES